MSYYCSFLGQVGLCTALNGHWVGACSAIVGMVPASHPIATRDQDRFDIDEVHQPAIPPSNGAQAVFPSSRHQLPGVLWETTCQYKTDVHLHNTADNPTRERRLLLLPRFVCTSWQRRRWGLPWAPQMAAVCYEDRHGLDGRVPNPSTPPSNQIVCYEMT